MPRLIACSSCQAHVRADDSGGCPHCGAPLRAEGGVFATTAIAALMGLSGVVVGCEKNGGSPVEPEYGAPVVEPMPADSGDPLTPSEPEYGLPAVEPDPSDDPPAEPEYGVPAIGPDPVDDPPAEPEYGVAISDPEIQPDYGIADPLEP